MNRLAEGLLGGWRLESFISRSDGTDEVRYPFGEKPSGLILYTSDGHMSAQLTPGDHSQFVSYGGRFDVDEAAAEVCHRVMISTMPELLHQPQIRHARIDGDRLTLSATQTSATGRVTQSTLVWRRDTG
ncbi:lipocalin-like domain-containing protein [Mycobacterium vicinigordonae]|uniref:Lipocalin-like domain-containing protein n=1 Tax=Mycobacterium vicinigordonae TaxID=1719132 RepID=A0A7D6DWX9_9MYCO|nr:lipocalin-like domain-containing protein [Mycobacterium vicinigordonae]QLL06049.1 lipocalin-like domain-containing protein [Mycobacterium vicinigordonae]